VEAAGTWNYRQLALVVRRDPGLARRVGSASGRSGHGLVRELPGIRGLLLALAGPDAWPVLVNPRLSAREIDEIRDHCGARRVLYTTSVSPHAREHAKRHGAVIGGRRVWGRSALVR